VEEEQSLERDFLHRKGLTSLDRPRSRAQCPSEHHAGTPGSQSLLLRNLGVGAWGCQETEGRKHYHEEKRERSPSQTRGGWLGLLSFAVE